ITVHTTVRVTGDTDEERAEALLPTKASLGFYIGGMGAKGQNYHTKLMARMGFEEEARHIQDLFFEGRREEAIAAVPDQFADEISLVGSPERIRDRLAAWEESPVTGINVGARSVGELRAIAEVILG
ncbi:MAG: LLM class flavin-dependent oxidoreductase, partial [bacterium]|nr:LLM class flavin-dependent oxidoreductase [bacterium]